MVTFELRPEGNGGVFQAEHSSFVKTLKKSTCGTSSEEQGSVWLGQNMGRITGDNARKYWH